MTIRNSRHIILRQHGIDYPTPANFNYLWSFGSLAGIFLAIQIVSGLFLAMHFTPHVAYAFYSVEHIMRDVNYGWLLRYIHSNGASFFFVVVYAHIGKGLYYHSYQRPYANLWRVGMIIFVLMMATAFMGYVLPWGQMSFWGATVITNLFTAVPYVGESIAIWLWGGFSVDNATLNRFFSFHFFLPFVIAAVVFLHLGLLHVAGSTNPSKLIDNPDKITFYPYFFLKDVFGLLVVLWFFSFFVFFAPNYLGHPDNYIQANPLSTPSHIVPEWYFLPFYAILRSIPDKLGGVLYMAGSILLLFYTPIRARRKRGELIINCSYPKVKPYTRFLFFMFVVWVFLLGWIGGQPVEYPFLQIGQFLTFLYFFYFILLKLLNSYEHSLLYKYLVNETVSVVFIEYLIANRLLLLWV